MQDWSNNSSGWQYLHSFATTSLIQTGLQGHKELPTVQIHSCAPPLKSNLRSVEYTSWYNRCLITVKLVHLLVSTRSKQKERRRDSFSRSHWVYLRLLDSYHKAQLSRGGSSPPPRLCHVIPDKNAGRARFQSRAFAFLSCETYARQQTRSIWLTGSERTNVVNGETASDSVLPVLFHKTCIGKFY